MQSRAEHAADAMLKLLEHHEPLRILGEGAVNREEECS